MEMVVCSGVATLWLCRDKAWAISPGSAAEQASNAPFSDLNKSFQAFLKTFEIASLTKFFICYMLYMVSQANCLFLRGVLHDKIFVNNNMFISA